MDSNYSAETNSIENNLEAQYKDIFDSKRYMHICAWSLYIGDNLDFVHKEQNLPQPFFKARVGEPEVIVKMHFFITINGTPRIVRILYRVFDYDKNPEPEKIYQEIKRAVEPIFYRSPLKSLYKAMSKIELAKANWDRGS
jgi:hypothetical protein